VTEGEEVLYAECVQDGGGVVGGIGNRTPPVSSRPRVSGPGVGDHSKTVSFGCVVEGLPPGRGARGSGVEDEGSPVRVPTQPDIEEPVAARRR
jgi:hypothetical protein